LISLISIADIKKYLISEIRRLISRTPVELARVAMRVFSLLCVLHAAGAMPTYAHSALDRQHAAMYLQLGECLWAALPATRPPGTSTATYDMDLERAAAAATRRDGDLVLCLTLSAAEPFVRRFLFVPGPVRLSLARLAADHALEGFGDMSMNVFRNFRLRRWRRPTRGA